MRRPLLLVFLPFLVALSALALPAKSWAQSNTDFSGTWALDASRSTFAAERPAVLVTLLIEQTASDLTIQTKQGDEIQVATYHLDGSISTRTRPNGNLVLSKSHWDGAKLITESRGILGEDEDVKTISATTEIRSLDGNGGTLILEATTRRNQGAGFSIRCSEQDTTCVQTKHVFTRAR